MTEFNPKGDKTLVENVPITTEQKNSLLHELQVIRYENFHPDELIGLCYLDESKMQDLFGPMIKETFGLDVTISRAWGHFMKKGATRPIHQHGSECSFLFYLVVPEPKEKTAKIYFPTDSGNVLGRLQENDLWIFPSMIEHGITEHQNEEIRWAIAGECSLVKA